MPPNIELKETSLAPSGPTAEGSFVLSSSLNVYFESDTAGSACLFPSQHTGHKWFLGEAESCKEKFLASMQAGRYFECSDIITALAFKLMEKGNIYERKLGNQNVLQGHQWQPVSGFNDVRDLVFRALLTHYMTTAKVMQGHDDTSEIAAVLAAMPYQTPRDYGGEKTTNSSLVGRPQCLLQAANSSSAATPRRNETEPKQTMRIKSDKPVVLSRNDKATASTRPPQISTEMASKSVGAKAIAPPVPFIGVAKINDVICGDRREDGVPNIGHIGNALFYQRFSTMAARFAKASTEEKGKLALQCADMVRQLHGRFLVKVSEAMSAMEKPRFTELSLEDASWRVYWALEKGAQIAAPVSRKKAKKSKSPAKSPDAIVISPAKAVLAKAEVGDGGKKPSKLETGRDSSPILLERIPTHLTFVADVDSAAKIFYPSAATVGHQSVNTIVSSSPSAASKEGSTTINKADRVRRRREKLQRAKDILAGRQPADPFADMTQLRRASIEELKKRQKRTQIRKRLATWDPDE